MKKINIFFDSKIFIESFPATSGRTGVFFVAWNILQHMLKNNNFHIILTYPYEYEISSNLRKIKKSKFFSQFKFVNFELEDSKLLIKQKIERHKENKRYIKLFYNHLRLIKIRVKEIILYRKYKVSFTNVNIYLSPYYAISKNILKNSHIKKIYVLYDTIPIIFSDYYDIPDYNALIKTLNKDIYSFCISQSCKNDYLKYCSDKLDANKMFVTHIATNQHYVPNYDKQELVRILRKYGVKHNQSDKYLFSLCSIEPRKNLPFTIICFCKFIKKHNIQDLYFYLGGGCWRSFESIIEKTIEEFCEFRQKIKLLGYIDNSDTNILYSNSLFFTFLSQYEGFGMPPWKLCRREPLLLQAITVLCLRWLAMRLFP